MPIQYAVIGKARGEFWNGIAGGALAAEKQLGLPRGAVVADAPEQAEAAAQVILMEQFVARHVRGIAIAPSDPRALALSIKRARAAGIWVITFDSDAPDSERQFFLGTSARTSGREAALVLMKLMGSQGGKVAPGSTLLDAAASDRLAAFKEALKTNDRLSVLDTSDDGGDASRAAQFARALVTNQKDLVGAYGVNAYNTLAWCRVVKETRSASKLTLVGVGLSSESIACLQDGAVAALVAPRPLALATQSVLALDSLARKGLIATAIDLKFDLRTPASAWFLDTGVDIITRDGKAGLSLPAYAAHLDEQNIPHDWKP